MHDPRRVAILISGRGSNMRALVERADGYDVTLIVSNKPGALGLQWARERGLATWALESKGLGKEDYDRQLSATLEEHGIGTIALAGFMRILSPWFVERWRGRILNIHPSLLPKYRGLDTHAHVVTEELDAGDVLGQAEVPIEPEDTPVSLEQRVLVAEHALYPKVLSEFVRR